MDTYMDKHLCIFVVLLLGLYFYSYHGQKVLENFSVDRDCPDILIQHGSKIYLRNTKLAEIPGVNPITFDNLEEYVEFLNWQKSQGINCDVLYLKHEYDAQGNGVYKVRPDIVETAGGSQAIPPGNIPSLDDVTVPSNKNFPFPAQLPEKQELMDASRNDPPFNANAYPGYDPDNQYLGVDTPLDKMYHEGENKHLSDNAMDTNWGGKEYSQRVVDSGYYDGNIR
tara:strand:+ start:383 stop:1057 length:675 start_codon:yes stop_codon:yes gene_type:complete